MEQITRECENPAGSDGEKEKLQKSHLHIYEVYVWCEAEGDFSVVRVVLAISNVDVHVNLVVVGLDEHPESKRTAGQPPCNAHISPPGCRLSLVYLKEYLSA